MRFAYTARVNGCADAAGPKTPQRRECMLSADEFMRRYLQRVLPPGQHRVRYFGWLHPAAIARRMKVETLLAVVIVAYGEQSKKGQSSQKKGQVLMINIRSRSVRCLRPMACDIKH